MATQQQQQQVPGEERRVTLENLQPHELKVLVEHEVKFEDMANEGYDFREDFIDMGIMDFFYMNNSVYENLVKEFWTYAWSKDRTILSYVQGRRIAITQDLIAEITHCPNEGAVETTGWEKDAGGWGMINETIYERPGGTKAVEMKNRFRALFRIIMNCLVPKSGSVDTVSSTHKFIMWHYELKAKINLPQMAFDHLRRDMMYSRKGKHVNVPYGKLLSAIMENQGLIKHLHGLNTMEAGLALKTMVIPVLSADNLRKMRLLSKKLIAEVQQEGDGAKKKTGKKGK